MSGAVDVPFFGISIDSRGISQGQLFWALRGERFDGHHFVDQAVESGAIGAVVGQCFILPTNWTEGKVLIQVPDRLKALQDFAKYLRCKISAPVIAVTGSNGMTTTKEMIASILNESGRVLKTEGNQNNLIGLPLTLTRLSSKVDSVVLELGMNDFGEIRKLTRICNPDVGVVTNIGPAHLEFFGSLEKISQAKAELFEEMNSDGVAVINYDDPFCGALAKNINKVITFGLSKEAMVKAENLHQGKNLTFTLYYNEEQAKITLPLIGKHNVYNALAAAAATLALKVPLSNVRRGLENVTIPPMRMVQFKTGEGYTIINDAYNANPISVRVAIETLVQCKKRGRAILVLGDMLELGNKAEKFHREVGSFIAQRPIEYLFTSGPLAHWIAEEALAGGMKKDHVFVDFSQDEIANNLKNLLLRGDSVLVKGSRGVKMEKVVELLVEN